MIFIFTVYYEVLFFYVISQYKEKKSKTAVSLSSQNQRVSEGLSNLKFYVSNVGRYFFGFGQLFQSWLTYSDVVVGCTSQCNINIWLLQGGSSARRM